MQNRIEEHARRIGLAFFYVLFPLALIIAVIFGRVNYGVVAVAIVWTGCVAKGWISRDRDGDRPP